LSSWAFQEAEPAQAANPLDLRRKAIWTSRSHKINRIHMSLYHFSDNPDIGVFTPRPVLIPSQRPAGFEWLNGPLVWAVDDFHQPMYLFPRDCPRILVWPQAETTPEDRERWFGGRSCHAIAHIEWAWFDRVRTETLYRYELPEASFQDSGVGAGWVSREPVTPIKVETLRDLPAALRARGVELRVMESLRPLKGIWKTSLHASGLRLRNALDWEGCVSTA
jgi:hypothetical protein